MSEASENGGQKMQDLLQAQQAFNLLMLDAEISVHRELISVLLARGSQTQDPLKTTEQIHRLTADRANKQLAALSDHFPDFATFFAQLLEQWKKSRQI